MVKTIAFVVGTCIFNNGIISVLLLILAPAMTYIAVDLRNYDRKDIQTVKIQTAYVF